jgi:hypothetical protein
VQSGEAVTFAVCFYNHRVTCFEYWVRVNLRAVELPHPRAIAGGICSSSGSNDLRQPSWAKGPYCFVFSAARVCGLWKRIPCMPSTNGGGADARTQRVMMRPSSYEVVYGTRISG